MQGQDMSHLPGPGDATPPSYDEDGVDVEQLIAEFHDHPRIWGSYCVEWACKQHEGGLCDAIVRRLEAAIDDLE